MKNQKFMKTIAGVIGLIVLLFSIAAATNSRVECMGKQESFFMDDNSIFWNPANINVYPNFLTGELGVYDTSGDAILDPVNPMFGGIYAHKLSKSKGSDDLFPMLTVGGVLNRKDKLIDVVKNAGRVQLFDSVNTSGDSITHYEELPDPVVNSDLFIGYTTKSGKMFGVHTYVAYQNSGLETEAKTISIIKGDVGCNMPLTKSLDLEVSVGVSNLAYNHEGTSVLPERDISVSGKARLFSAMNAINGEFVPVLEVSRIKMRDYLEMKMGGGAGINVGVDRGFFWMGAQVFKVSAEDTVDAADGKRAETTEAIEVPIGFGIERNVMWDWFLVRVGVNKTIRKVDQTINGTNYVRLEENAESDGSMGDHVGFGVGLNVEDKLRFDLTVAEELPYTLGNLFNGDNSPRLFTRISSTFSF